MAQRENHPLKAEAAIGQRSIFSPRIYEWMSDVCQFEQQTFSRKQDIKNGFAVYIETKEKSLNRRRFRLSGRGSRIRTRDIPFWRRTLYQLSYAPSKYPRFHWIEDHKL